MKYSNQNNKSKTPSELAEILTKFYGRSFSEMIYTKGVGISGRIRFSEIQKNTDRELDSIIEIISDPNNKSFYNKNEPGANFAGYVWAEDFFRVTGEKKYIEILTKYANLYKISNPKYPPEPSDISFRSEDIFFTSALLGRAYNFTKNLTFSKILFQYLNNITTQKPDGLFKHNISTPWNWGRSNGFAAIGYSEALTYLHEHKEKIEYQDVLDRHTAQIEILVKLQNEDGTWMQVLDDKSSYHEFSVTCMIGYALARGIRMGWLDQKFCKSLYSAFSGIASRIDKTGKLKKVCVGTGVQKTLQEYLNRPAASGFDHRGGSLALWFLTEFILFEHSQENS